MATEEALAELLAEVKEIVARDGGLERALKKAKIREKQEREVKGDGEEGEGEWERRERESGRGGRGRDGEGCFFQIFISEHTRPHYSILSLLTELVADGETGEREARER